MSLYVKCAEAATKNAPRCIHGLRSEVILDLTDIGATLLDCFWQIPLGDESLSEEAKYESVFYRLGYNQPGDKLLLLAHDAALEAQFESADGLVPPYYVQPYSDQHYETPRVIVTDHSTHGYDAEGSYSEGEISTIPFGRDAVPIPVSCRFCNENKGVYHNIIMAFNYLDDEVGVEFEKIGPLEDLFAAISLYAECVVCGKMDRCLTGYFC